MNSTPTPNGALNTRQFVLATDLDGTFLGGSGEDRKRLYDWIEANRATVGLIFVTGRDPELSASCAASEAFPGLILQLAMSAPP